MIPKSMPPRRDPGLQTFRKRSWANNHFAMSLKESPPAAIAAKSHVSRGATPEEMLARVLFRAGLMLVIDKPAGLSVHRGPKGGPSLEDYLDGLRYGLPRRPELAHRLDEETSGRLVPR